MGRLSLLMPLMMSKSGQPMRRFTRQIVQSVVSRVCEADDNIRNTIGRVFANAHSRSVTLPLNTVESGFPASACFLLLSASV